MLVFWLLRYQYLPFVLHVVRPSPAEIMRQLVSAKICLSVHLRLSPEIPEVKYTPRQKKPQQKYAWLQSSTNNVSCLNHKGWIFYNSPVWKTKIPSSANQRQRHPIDVSTETRANCFASNLCFRNRWTTSWRLCQFIVQTMYKIWIFSTWKVLCEGARLLTLHHLPHRHVKQEPSFSRCSYRYEHLSGLTIKHHLPGDSAPVLVVV